MRAAPIAEMRTDSIETADVPTVLLVDDSIVARSILERIIEQTGRFRIVGSVPGAAEALELLGTCKPDIVVLDIEMPGMNGLAALPLILRSSPRSRVLILSASAEDGGPAAMQAMAQGAADTMVKPGRGGILGTFGETLLDRLHQLAESDMPVAPAPGGTPMPDAPTAMPRHTAGVAAIGIGASTGGIMAINGFFGALPERVTCPIFVTQHLPPTFIPFFADQLRRLSTRTIHVADDGMEVAPATVYLAPGDGHITLVSRGSRHFIRLDRSASSTGATPSVDPMMQSLADTYGAAACGVMLSGMGRDGIDGAMALHRAGGLMLAQDLESCVVWGMPGAVARAGIAAAVRNPMALAAIVAKAATRHSADTLTGTAP